MAETSYPVAGGGTVSDAAYEDLMAPVMGQGRVTFSPNSSALSQPLMYADSTGRQVKLRPNEAVIVRGFRWETDGSGLTRSLDANTSGLPRLDMGVLELDREDFTVRFQIIKGTPAANPVPPTAVQQEGPNGVFQWPVGLARVSSSNLAGQPSIASSDITPLDYFLTPPGGVGHSGRRPSNPYPGQRYSEYDTGREWVSLNNTWHLIGENGALVAQSTLSGWGDPYILCRRRNGFVVFQALMKRTGAAITGGADSNLATLEERFRPPNDMYLVGYQGAGLAIRAHIASASGILSLRNYGATINTNDYITIHPATWPVK